MESCEGCGFVWDDVPDADVATRLRAGTEMLGRLLRSTPDVASARPTPDRWSMLEYGAHVRDVLLVLRDRFVVGVVTDNPGSRRCTATSGSTWACTAARTRRRWPPSSRWRPALLARMLEALSPEQLELTCQYGYPGPSTRTLRWMAAQAVHEVEHHLGDVEENLTLVAD